ncbi:MAG: FHA domain-containing protein [Vulcanimicrobiota bacterium]
MSSTDEIESGLCLKVMEGSHQQEVHPLTRASISIGRATPETPYTPAYLTFPEPTLSRLHAELIWNPGKGTFTAHHRSQTNPTLINGRNLTRAVELSPGDTLALGRLVVVLDVAPKPESRTEPLVAPPTAGLTLKNRQTGASQSFSISQPQVQLRFADLRSTTAMTSDESAGQARVISVASQQANEINLRFDEETDTITVETRLADPPAYRVSHVPSGLLSIPLRPAGPAMLLEDDYLFHQDHEFHFRLAPHGSDTTLENKKTREFVSDPANGVLHFLNGGWAGATLEVPHKGATAFELGPRSRSFHHLSPLTNSPTCQITMHDGKVQLRVLHVAEDQFLDVDGDLYFTGEATSLFSGSRILVGEFEFVWVVPGIQQRYSRFSIVSPEGNHPMLKQQVRLGTAAHCEVSIRNPALAPVVGTLRLEKDELLYRHTNIAAPARVDGFEISAGLEAQVQVGTKLELAEGVTIGLEEVE